MLAKGVYLPPSQFEAMFLSLAHGEADVDRARPGGRQGPRGRLSAADPAPIVRYGRYGAVAFEFSGSIAAGAVIGWWIDRWLGTEPYVLVAARRSSPWSAASSGLIQVLRRFERRDLERQP